MSDHDYTFLARYGATILRGGIASIPNALFAYQAQLGLAPQHVWFVCTILRHKWDANHPYPSLSTLETESGVSRRQLQYYQRDLISLGFLQIVERVDRNGARLANAYDFTPLFARLEELLRREGRGDFRGSPPVQPIAPPPAQPAAPAPVQLVAPKKKQAKRSRPEAQDSTISTGPGPGEHPVKETMDMSFEGLSASDRPRTLEELAAWEEQMQQRERSVQRIRQSGRR